MEGLCSGSADALASVTPGERWDSQMHILVANFSPGFLQMLKRHSWQKARPASPPWYLRVALTYPFVTIGTVSRAHDSFRSPNNIFISFTIRRNK